MLRLVCAHLLGQPGVVRVCADTEVDHIASRRVMEKAGMSWRRDDTYVRDGRETTLTHYAIDRGPQR
jgi:RimJ/RimL family protein N-acetyltransferase